MLHPHTHSAGDVIGLLGLQPLPQEGGWFRRTREAAVANATAPRAWSMILALFTPEHFSALHRLASDELWLFHAGDPLELLLLSEDAPAGRTRVVLGSDALAGHQVQAVVRANCWQGARPRDDARWSLVTCVVVPEFRWEGFQLGRRADAIARFPAHAALIQRLTRE